MNPKDITTVFFDFGGTCIFDNEGDAAGFAHAVTDLVHPLTAEQVGHARGSAGSSSELDRMDADPNTDPRDYFLARHRRWLEVLGIDKAKIKPIAIKLVERLSFYTREYLFPDVRATLEGLRAAGYKLGIISNYNFHLLHDIRRLGIDGFFDVVMISNVEGVGKPEPEFFHRALSGAGCEPYQAVHTGDSYGGDLLGAQGVGMAAFLLDREHEHDGPECPTIDTLLKLMDWLDVPYPPTDYYVQLG